MVMAGQLILNDTGSRVVWGGQRSFVCRVRREQAASLLVSTHKSAMHKIPCFLCLLSVGRCKNSPRTVFVSYIAFYLIGFMRFFSVRL